MKSDWKLALLLWAGACMGCIVLIFGGEQVAGAKAPSTRVYDINDLVRLAERKNAGVRAATHAIRAAEAQLAEAKVAPFFQFTATAAFGLKPDQRGVPTFSQDGQLPFANAWGPVVGLGVQGAIPIYTFGKIDSAKTAARAGVRAAEEQRKATLAQLRYDVRRAYFTLQYSLDLQQLVEEGSGKLKQAEQVMVSRQQDEDSDANPLDRYRLSTLVAELDARSAEITRAENSSRDAIHALTGLGSFRVPDCPLAPLRFQPKSKKYYRSKALLRRPELKMLKQARIARSADLKIHRSRYFPDLALALGASHSYSPGTTDQTNPFIRDGANLSSFEAGLVARWSLDFLGNRRRVQRSEEQLFQLRDQSEQARGGVAFEATLVFEKTVEAQKREEAWAKGEREARTWFVAAAQGFQVGTLETKDLVDAVKAYFGARFNHIDATQKFNSAVAELEKVSGIQELAAADWNTSCGE